MRRNAVRSAMLIVVLSSVKSAGSVHQPAFADPFDVLRVADPQLTELVSEANQRSAIFRALVAKIRASGWLVFVQAGPCPDKATIACVTHFVGTFERSPYMRVLVADQRRHRDNLIATLAHELHHVWEIAEQPGVTDWQKIRALFQRIGTVSVHSSTATTYETTAARRTGEQVLRELQGHEGALPIAVNSSQCCHR